MKPTLIPEQSSSNPKELLFSGGAGAVGFQMGYCQGLIEIVGKDRLREYTFGGVSAGCAVAAYFYLALHDEKRTMKDSYYAYARQMFEKNNKKYGGLFTSCETVERLALQYWDMFEKEQHLPSFKGKLHFYISEIGKSLRLLSECCVDVFHSREDFGSAVAASCAIPMVTTFGFSRKFRGVRVVDGGMTKPIPFKHSHSRKVFLNVLPEFCNFIQKTPSNIAILNITQKSDVSFPKDFWLWSEHWSDEMFLKGYLASLNDRQNIESAFQMECNA